VFFFNIAIPFEIFKSPLEKAKTEVEKHIFIKLGKSINAYGYKYVSIIYANEHNGRVCYATIEETLAHCFLKNTWDREKIVSSIDKCGKTDITMKDYKKTLPTLYLMVV
jgi:exosome complex RNA-binding protein Rrp42 (RNase PH superfamily)